MIDLGYATPAPEPPRRRRNTRAWILGGGLAVAVAGAVSVASIASAQTPSPSASPSAPPSAAAKPSAAAPKAPGRPGRMPDFGGKALPFGPGGPGGALHGEYTTIKPGGGYQTIDVQQGQVTAVSTGSITVKSDDGFSKSYTVTESTLVDAQRDGIGSVKVGDTVSVQATVSGSTATATDITDRSQVRQAHPRPSQTK